MATASYVASLLGGIDQSVRRVMTGVFDYVLGNLRFGSADHQTRAENFQMYAFAATTPAVADTEFSIVHGLRVVPKTVMPVMQLSAVGERMVRLKVTRVADTQRVYLSSPDTDAPIRVWIEV